MTKPIPWWKDPQFPLNLENHESPAIEEPETGPQPDEDFDDIYNLSIYPQ